MLKDIAFVMAILGGVVVLAGAIYLGIARTEYGECTRWQEDATRYPNFYITEWQEAQCNHHSVVIDAPVR